MEPQTPAPQTPAPAPTPTPQPSPTPTPPPAPEPQPTPVGPAPMTGEAPAAPVASGTPVVTGKGKSGNKLLVILLAALVIAAALGYGAYAYFTSTPEYMLRESANKLVKAKSMAAKFTVSGGDSAAQISFNGDIMVKTDPDNPANGQATIGLGAGDSRLSIDYMSLDGSYYMQFGNLKNIGNLMGGLVPEAEEIYKGAAFKKAADQVSNKWYVLDQQTLQQFGGELPATGSADEADVKKALEIFNKYTIFKADKVLADETIEGATCAHFTVKLDKPAFVAFVNELKAANLKSFQITDEMAQQANEVTETIPDGQFEVWIYRGSREFKQFKLSGGDSEAQVAFTVTMTTAPQPAKPEKPAEARPFMELMNTLIQSMLPAGSGNLQLNASDFDQL